MNRNYQDEFAESEKEKGYREGKATRKRKKGRPNTRKRERPEEERSSSNDPMWYAHSKQLLDATASFPYSWPVGGRLNTNCTTIDTGSVPGIMAMYTVPSVGWATSATDPINVAARNIYSYVRHANSGAKNYDSIDLMKYYIAMDSCYSYLSFLQRLYGIVKLSSVTNRYYPQALVQAMGVDYDSVYGSLAQLNYMINAYANRIQSMCVPATMSYFVRHAWMYSGYYLDSLNDKAQIYMYTPQGFFQYTEPTSPGPGTKLWPLVYKELVTKGTAPGPGLSYDDLVQYGLDLLNPILASEDFNIMSGDTLKAFGTEGVLKVAAVPTDYTVLPSYDEVVLSQIMNANILGYPASGYKIVEATNDQDAPAGYLESRPTAMLPLTDAKFDLGDQLPEGYYVSFNYHTQYGVSTGVDPVDNSSGMYTPYFMKRFVTFQDGNVTPERTMDATRLTYTAKTQPTITGTINYGPGVSKVPIMSPNEVYAGIKLEGIASEWVCAAVMFYYSVSSVTGKWQLGATPKLYTAQPLIIDETGHGLTANVNDALIGATPFLVNIARLSQFDWHPAVIQQYITLRNWTQNDTLKRIEIDIDIGDPVGIVEDIGYYAIVSNDDIQRLTMTALLSEFSVPQMGSFDNKLR